jgi:Tfp pilus assembly protein PilN
VNAVNLAPTAPRRSVTRTSLSPQFLGLVAGLLVVLIATFMYVSARDRVHSRQQRLAQVTAASQRWAAAAAGYGPTVQQLAQRAKTITEVRALVAQRYDWSQLLSQLAGVMPAQTQLTSLQAGAPASAAAAAAAAATGTTVATTGIQLAACAASQTVVADTMVALRRVSGISQVTLSTSSTSNSASADVSAGGGTCHYPVSFSLSLQFAPALGQTPSTSSTASLAASTTAGAAQ